MTIHYTKAGLNRGNVRAWLENAQLLTGHGFAPNTRYSITYQDNSILLRADENGSRKVSSTFKGPIIDLNNKQMNQYDFSNGIKWTFTDGQIVISGRSE